MSMPNPDIKLIPPLAASIVTILAASGIAVAQPDESPRNQLVRVVTISQEGLKEEPGKPMLEATMTRVERAASFEPDIVCLPETFTRGEPETVPGPTTNRLSAWAKKNASYVICPISVRDGERVFNSAILIDRAGHIVGRYDKIRPTEGELEKSICPGAIDPPASGLRAAAGERPGLAPAGFFGGGFTDPPGKERDPVAGE